MSEDGSPTPFSVSLSATDADVTDTLTWTLAPAPLAAHGTPGVSGTGASPVVTYTPTANYSGSDSFGVQVSDGHGGTDTITVNVTIQAINDPPVLAGIEVPALSYTENAVATTISSTISVSDLDNTTLTGATVQITGNYANGQDVLSATPAGSITLSGTQPPVH